MISIALPKGRLGRAALERMGGADGACALEGQGRRLVLEDEARNVRYFLVKPSDTAIYVEHGVADIGIAGRDVLLETRPDVYELHDLGFGCCSMAVAAPTGWHDARNAPLRIATTYPTCAREHFDRKGRQIETITLHGSVELAPLLGLSDVIVDLVETGATLRENGLEAVERIFESSARLIANKSSYLFKRSEIDAVIQGMLETPASAGIDA